MPPVLTRLSRRNPLSLFLLLLSLIHHIRWSADMEQLQAELRRLLRRPEVHRSRFALDQSLLQDPKVVTAVAGFLILLLVVYCEHPRPLRRFRADKPSHIQLKEIVAERWTRQCITGRPGRRGQDVLVCKSACCCWNGMLTRALRSFTTRIRRRTPPSRPRPRHSPSPKRMERRPSH